MPSYSCEMNVRFKDLDGMGHVNNAVYLTFLETARMRFFTEEGGAESEKDIPFILAHAAVDYKAPIKMGARIKVTFWTSRVGGKSWDFEYEIKDAKKGTVYGNAKTVQVAYDYQLEKTDFLMGDLETLVRGLMP